MIVNTLWIGNKLGAVHSACLRSFLRHGHQVVLHAYEQPCDMPSGVTLFDARRLMAEEEIVVHKGSGSLALASDIYRYRIQREGLGLYVDCDIYCIRPFVDADYILSRECDSYYNPAVLKVPQGSDLLLNLLNASEDSYFIPPWLNKTKYIKRKIQKKMGFGKHISKQQWGVIGPKLLTHYIKKMDLHHLAEGAHKYSPVHPNMSHLLFERGLSVGDLVTSKTLGLHLFNAGLKGRAVVECSPLYEIIHTK